jgi:hypothetical protein
MKQRHTYVKNDEHIVPHVQINRVKSKMTHSIPAIPLKYGSKRNSYKQECLKQGISKKKATKDTQFCSFGEITFYYFSALEITF